MIKVADAFNLTDNQSMDVTTPLQPELRSRKRRKRHAIG
jgi:hypothetical protein